MGATNLPIKLPPDSRGVISGALYESFLHAGFGHQFSTGRNTPHIPRLGRSVHCLSSIEYALVLALCLNPALVDYREQYPMCDLEMIREFLKADARIPRNLVPTLDGVATFSRGNGGLSYVGFSGKPSDQLRDEAVVSRLTRESAFCDELGWGWQLFTEREANRTTTLNAKQILSWANTVEVQFEEAQRLVEVLRKTSASDNLMTRLEKSAKRSTIAPDRISAVFAHAVLEGLIRLDHTATLTLRRPLVLLSESFTQH